MRYSGGCALSSAGVTHRTLHAATAPVCFPPPLLFSRLLSLRGPLLLSFVAFSLSLSAFVSPASSVPLASLPLRVYVTSVRTVPRSAEDLARGSLLVHILGESVYGIQSRLRGIVPPRRYGCFLPAAQIRRPPFLPFIPLTSFLYRSSPHSADRPPSFSLLLYTR